MEHETYAQQAAEDFHWGFQKVEGDMRYLDAVVNDPWDDERFLICPPTAGSKRIIPTKNSIVSPMRLTIGKG